jgi:hypothetical protein
MQASHQPDQYVEDCIMFLAGQGNYIFGETVSLDPYDGQIVHSLGKQLGNGEAFTEKQSVIGLRLVKKYSSLLISKGFDADTILNDKLFKWPFRTIDRTKSLYIDGEQIVIKSPFIAEIVNKIKKRKKPSYIKGTYNGESKEWAFPYNEPNVEFLYTLVQGMHFNIDSKIKQDYDKIISVKRQALEKINVPMLVKKMGGYLYNDLVIEELDPRRAIMQAKLKGCNVIDDAVVNDLKPKHGLDKILIGDSRNWHINSNLFSYLDIFDLIKTVDTCIIMCTSNDISSLKTIIESLFTLGYSKDDIAVMFRYKTKDYFEGNKYIKDQGVNEFNTNKKIFIINEKLPKPLLSNNIDPQLIYVCLPVAPSHYKTQAWLGNKANVLYYCGSSPSGVENCANL